MARFNAARNTTTEVTNHAGGTSVAINDSRFKLYSMVATNFVDSRFYMSGATNLKQLRSAIAGCPPLFVAKLAVYARTQLNLRSVPLVLMVELAKIHRGDDLVSRGLYGSIGRADEMAEALAYYQVANEGNLKKLSKQVVKGVAASFDKFDEYQFSKYKGSGKDITLRDAMFLTHPKPADAARVALFKKIADNTLTPPETWEVAKTRTGQKLGANATNEDKIAASRETWEGMIDSRKLGYMAMLRNLRNFIQDDISMEHVDKVCAFLTNRKAVANSKQLPFRFYTAYREINAAGGAIEPMFSGSLRSQLGLGNAIGFEVIEKADVAKVRKILAAIKGAGILSLSNIAMFDSSDRVVTVCDVSGSMTGKSISGDSTVKPIEVGLFYGSMMHHLNPSCRMAYFGERFGFERSFDIDPFQQPTKHSQLSREYGHSTNAHSIFDELLSKNIAVDKLIVYSDMQFWDSTKSGWGSDQGAFIKKWNKYKAQFPQCKLILIDLVGYGGSTPVKSDGQTLIVNGFSAETFKVLGNLSNSRQILDEIEAVEL